MENIDDLLQDDWVYFEQIDWNCPGNNRFNIDTRDFHTWCFFSEEQHPDFYTLNKYRNRFFHSEEELKEVITRLYNESGGKGEWRCLILTSEDRRVTDWNLKYIRIWRTEKGFILCNSENEALTKDLLKCKVNLKFLAHQ